jgi:F0F1-type ATP synthase assembly protein I
MSEEPRRSGEPAEAEEEEDLASRFPDVESDERLHPAELPEAPRVTFERPKTQTAQGLRAEEGKDTIHFGRLGNMSGKEIRNAGIASTLGWGLVGSIIGGAILGHLVDLYLLHNPQTPWGIIVGVLIGVVSGFASLIRTANRLNQDE